MKPKHYTLRVLGTLLVPAALLLLPAQAEGAILVLIPGIEGEATDPQHENWIDVLNIAWSFKRPTTGGSGQNRRLGSPVAEDLRLTLRLDKAAPELALKGLTGDVIEKLEIEHTANYGGVQRTYLRAKLENVSVTSFRTTDSSESDSRFEIQLSLHFDKIEWVYKQYDETGAEIDSTQMSWNFQEGVGA